MAIWYEVEETEEGMRDFMECNCCFHDFNVERATFFPQKGIVELFMKYDELEGSVMLRFVGVKAFHFPADDDEYLWLSEATLTRSDEGDFLWHSGEPYADAETVKQTAVWVEAKAILWAVTDSRGVPAEMPAGKLDQMWDLNGKIERKRFSAKPFGGDAQWLE